MPKQSLLTLSAERTSITPEGGVAVEIAITLRQIVEKAFRQSWSATAQLEAAINLIEDAIMASGLRAMPRGSLVADAQVLRQAFQVTSVPVCLGIAEVEARYQGIALSAQRLPSAAISEIDPLPLAALILVRECMHHLGYSELALVGP